MIQLGTTRQTTYTNRTSYQYRLGTLTKSTQDLYRTRAIINMHLLNQFLDSSFPSYVARHGPTEHINRDRLIARAARASVYLARWQI